MQLGLWAARYNTWLLIKLMPKGVVFPFLSFLFLSFPFLSFPFLSFPFLFFSFLHMHMCHTSVHLADSQSVHRVWDKALHVEVEWTVGPIPIDDKKGKEVVLRYASCLHSGQNSNLLTYMPCIT